MLQNGGYMKGKITKKKLVLLIAGIVVSSVFAGMVIAGSISKSTQDKKNLYFALCYLKQNDYENAENYLEDVRTNTLKKFRFVQDASEIIRQYLIGNEVLFEIKLDLLQKDYKLKDTQKIIAEYLLDMTEEAYEQEEYENVVQALIRMLDISAKTLKQYETEYSIVTNAYLSGYMTQENYKKYEELCGEERAENLLIGVELSGGNYEAALIEAVERMKEKNSDENKLLLAEVIARSSFSSSKLEESYLYTLMGQEYDTKKKEKESAKVEEKLTQLQEEIDDISFKMQAETDGEAVAKWNEKLQKLYEKKQDLENQYTKAFVYRALNSISTISSVEADVMRAKLYFVLNQEEKAMSVLLDTANSIKLAFSDNTVIKQGLEVLKNLEKGHQYSVEALKTEVPNVLSSMFNYVSADIQLQDSNRFIENLAASMSNALLAEYKYVNHDIYITSFDSSAYPEITMRLNAREEVLEDIVKKKAILLKDTHHEVKYDAKFVEDVLSSICFVVDTSGSMDGTPIENAKKALVSFSKQTDADMDIALVEFNDSATILSGLSDGISSFMKESENLYANGGTEISAGIRCGVEALQDSAGAKNIILMTDGQSYLDNSVIEEAKEQNVRIYTVGFGSVDSTMLEEIAESTGGTFILADSSDDLRSVYESIGMIIGNSVEVTYQISENAEEEQRYVYIASKQYESVRKYEYSLTNETQDMGVVFTQGYAYGLADMEKKKQDNETVTLYVQGNGMEIQEITIHGQTIKPVKEYGSYYIEIQPIVIEGLYDAKVTFVNGITQTIEDCILIYDETLQSELRWISQVRIGCLNVSANEFYQLSTGEIVLYDTYFYENVTTENTLYASTNHLVVLDACTVSEDYYGNTWYYNWGDFGKFHLDGVIYLDRNDVQNQTGYRTISSIGKLSGEIDTQQCVIIVQ